MLAVLIVPVKLSLKRISKVVPIVFALFGSLPGPATSESAVETIAGIVNAVGVAAGLASKAKKAKCATFYTRNFPSNTRLACLTS